MGPKQHQEIGNPCDWNGRKGWLEGFELTDKAIATQISNSCHDNDCLLRGYCG